MILLTTPRWRHTFYQAIHTLQQIRYHHFSATLHPGYGFLVGTGDDNNSPQRDGINLGIVATGICWLSAKIAPLLLPLSHPTHFSIPTFSNDSVLRPVLACCKWEEEGR